MALPTWLQQGCVVHFNGPGSTACVVGVGDDTITVIPFGTSNEPIRFTLGDVVDGRIVPHRWVSSVEPMNDPFIARIVYHPGDSYEIRGHETAPPFPVHVGMTLLRRPSGETPASLCEVTRVRPRSGTIHVNSTDVPLTYAEVANDYIVLDTPSVEEIWRRVGTFEDVTVLDVVEENEISGRVHIQAARNRQTIPLIDFVLEYNAVRSRVNVPLWVSAGTTILNLRTNHSEMIGDYDNMTTVATLRNGGSLTLDDLLREWVPTDTSEMSVRSFVGTLWGFVNPTALVRVTAHSHDAFDQATFNVTLIGNGLHSQTFTGTELRTRAVELGQSIVIPSHPPWAGWAVGSTRRIDHRYMYVAAQTPEFTTFVSDYNLDDLDWNREIGPSDTLPDEIRRLLTDSEAITGCAPPSLDRDYIAHHRNIEMANQVRTQEVSVETLVSPLGIGSFWAWQGRALVEIVSETAVTVGVRIVPLPGIEDVPRAVFDIHAIELPYRSMVADHVLVPGRADASTGALICVGEPINGQGVLYSARRLDGQDVDDVTASFNRPFYPISTLGYPRRETAASESPEPTTPDEPLLAQGDVSIRPGQRWEVRFGPTATVFTILRIARDHDAIWLRAMDGDGTDRPISTAELRRLGHLITDKDPVNGDEWIEISTRRRGHVTVYDTDTRTVTLRWTANVSPREVTCPVAEFLERFRALTTEGSRSAVALRDAPSRPAWARLRRPRTTG